MAGGSATKQNPRDQQCDECGRWFHWRGISEHEKDCDGDDNDLDDDDVWDPRPDAPPGGGSFEADPGIDREIHPARDRDRAGHRESHGDSHPTEPTTDPENSQTTETMTDETDETTDTDEEQQCPHCGSKKNIKTSEEAIALYRAAGRLTDSIEAQLRRYDFYHNDHSCKGMWSA